MPDVKIKGTDITIKFPDTMDNKAILKVMKTNPAVKQMYDAYKFQSLYEEKLREQKPFTQRQIELITEARRRGLITDTQFVEDETNRRIAAAFAKKIYDPELQKLVEEGTRKGYIDRDPELKALIQKAYETGQIKASQTIEDETNKHIATAVAKGYPVATPITLQKSTESPTNASSSLETLLHVAQGTVLFCAVLLLILTFRKKKTARRSTPSPMPEKRTSPSARVAPKITRRHVQLAALWLGIFTGIYVWSLPAESFQGDTDSAQASKQKEALLIVGAVTAAALWTLKKPKD